jgi:hypothetical protein
MTGLISPRDRALYAAIKKHERSRRIVAAKMRRTKGPTPAWIKDVWVRRGEQVRALVA